MVLTSLESEIREAKGTSPPACEPDVVQVAVSGAAGLVMHHAQVQQKHERACWVV